MELRENEVSDVSEDVSEEDLFEKYNHNKDDKTFYFEPTFSIVWTPLPFISAICPWIGHVGFVDLKGNCFDFAGPYTITVNDLAFGKPYKYHSLDKKMILGEKKDALYSRASNFYLFVY